MSRRRSLDRPALRLVHSAPLDRHHDVMARLRTLGRDYDGPAGLPALHHALVLAAAHLFDKDDVRGCLEGLDIADLLADQVNAPTNVVTAIDLARRSAIQDDRFSAMCHAVQAATWFMPYWTPTQKAQAPRYQPHASSVRGRSPSPPCRPRGRSQSL